MIVDGESTIDVLRFNGSMSVLRILSVCAAVVCLSSPMVLAVGSTAGLASHGSKSKDDARSNQERPSEA